MALKKRDWILIALALIIILFLWAAPEESTKRVPFDDTHRRFYDIVAAEGKKAAEKFCEECHNPETMPLPEGHPPKLRCLLCHKLQERP